MRMDRATTERADRILLVDQETAFIEMFADRIQNESDMHVVGMAANGRGVEEILVETRPNVLVLDVNLTGPSAFEIARDAAIISRDTQILFLTSTISEGLIEQAARCRMSGYMSKSEHVETLISAIRTVARGGVSYSPQIADRLEHRNGAPHSLSSLTARQIEVLRNLANGASVKEVAAKMNLSEKSVDSHKYRIMRRLGIHDRVKLALFAVREGLVLP